MDTATPASATVTVAEAARRVGWHPADLRRAIRNEQVPVIRDGRRVRILAAWADNPAEWWAQHAAAMTIGDQGPMPYAKVEGHQPANGT